ncbi:MAG: SDR family NAD(P)-dependent oxidoreductase [Mariniblastus sp.]
MSTQRTILVTGASRGLGLAITRSLIDDGIKVIALSRSLGPHLRELIESHTELVRHVGFDLEVMEQLSTDWFQQEVCRQQPLHGVVNNAATTYDDLITNIQREPLEMLFRVNVIAPILLTKLAIRQMLLHDICGSLVHVSSISAHTGYKGLAMYAATKGAIEAFSKNTAREWGVRRIRSNCVVPGFMETDMSASLDDKIKERIYKRTSLNEATSLASVAGTVKFLLSDESKSITGQNVFVDSGTI